MNQELCPTCHRPTPSKVNLRSLEQNAKMWAMLSEVSEQKEWYGQRLAPEEWKDLFSASLKAQKVVPGLDGGFVVIGAHTSKMSVTLMNELIELMHAFAVEHGIKFKETALSL